VRRRMTAIQQTFSVSLHFRCYLIADIAQRHGMSAWYQMRSRPALQSFRARRGHSSESGGASPC
jgi:hypothetical protein